MAVLLYLLIFIGSVIVCPLLAIWALNTLFPVLAIPLTLESWVSVLIIGVLVRSITGVNIAIKK